MSNGQISPSPPRLFHTFVPSAIEPSWCCFSGSKLEYDVVQAVKEEKMFSFHTRAWFISPDDNSWRWHHLDYYHPIGENLEIYNFVNVPRYNDGIPYTWIVIVCLEPCVCIYPKKKMKKSTQKNLYYIAHQPRVGILYICIMEKGTNLKRNFDPS